MRSAVSGVCLKVLSALAIAGGAGLAGRAWAADTPKLADVPLLSDVKYLASDALEGRGVGSKGLDLAADFIRDQFAAAGLNVTRVNGGAFQVFTMATGAKRGEPNRLTFRWPAGQTIELALDADFVPLSFGGTGPIAGELVFCGYGIDAPDKDESKSYDDFAGIDLKGKIAVILRRAPGQADPKSRFSDGHGGVSSHAALTAKVSNAFGRGATAVLFVNDPASGRSELEQLKKRAAKIAESVAAAAEAFDAADPQAQDKVAAARQKLRDELTRYKAIKAELAQGPPDPLMKFGYGGDESVRSIPLMQITRAACDKLLKPALKLDLTELEAAIDKNMQPHSATLAGWTAAGQATIDRTQTEVKNVIGVLDGESPRAEETIVVGAHYDHVGRGGKGSLAPGSKEIHNGADDNASGTACLIELARRLAARKQKLSRRVVFIAFTGEEIGLIGSARYTAAPVFPLEKTIAMLNMDMVGRLSGDKLTVFGTGTSPVWPGLLDRFGKACGFQLSLKPEGFGPSDHSSFYAKRIPVLHFFTGNHGDYHRPTDDWEKLNVPGMERVVALLEEIVVELAQTTEPPAYAAVTGMANTFREGSRPYFGSIPDFSVEEPGYAISGVAPGSPADRGGLKGGDRIVQFGPQKIDNLDDFDRALRKYAAGDAVDVGVRRGGETLNLKVTLGAPR